MKNLNEILRSLDEEIDDPLPRKRSRRDKIIEKMPDQKRIKKDRTKAKQALHESKPKGFKHNRRDFNLDNDIDF